MDGFLNEVGSLDGFCVALCLGYIYSQVITRMALLPQYNVKNDQSQPQNQSPQSATARTLTPRPTTTGYAQVADFISTDKELAVYRRFDRTAARILLNLQSKIILKQKRLDSLDKEDASDPNDEKFLAAAAIYEEIREPNPRDLERQQLYEDLKENLKEYCESNKKFDIENGDL